MATVKKTAKKKTVRQLVPRTRNANTQTEAEFWSKIRSALRQMSRWWKPISIAKVNARRKYAGTNKSQKWEFQCAHCREWFMEKEIAVDHIVEAGTLTCGDDVKDFIGRLFVEADGLQVLCNKRKDGKESCHKIKTVNYMKERKVSKVKK